MWAVVEPPSRKWPVVLVTIAVAAVLLLSAMAVLLIVLRDDFESEPVGMLTIGVMENIDSLSPFVGQSLTSMIVYGLLYDCLQGVGEGMDTEGNLATSWTIDGDYEPYGSAWQYNLTENARWHDGEPFDAYDVAFTLNLHAKDYSSVWSHRPYAYFINHTEVVDSSTVRVHFYGRITEESMPVAFADSLLIPIMPRHMLENMTATEIGFSWTGVFEGHDPPIVGTGPFMAAEDVFDEFNQGDGLTLVRNPDYHRAVDRGEEISFEKISIECFDDATALSLALEHGDVDVAAFPPSVFSTLSSKVESGQLELIHAFNGPSCAQRQLLLTFSMNVDMFGGVPNPLICDPAIRKALSMATDKSLVIDEYYLGYADEGSSLIPPSSEEWHCEISSPLEFDHVAAAELLEEHGYRYTAESPDVRVATSDSLSVAKGWVEENASLTFRIVLMPDEYDLKDVVESWVLDWSEIGVAIDLTSYPGPIIPLAPPPSDLSVSKVATNHPDPNYVLYSQSSCAINGWNLCGYTNATYDQHYMGSVQQLDVELRRESVKECQRTHYIDAGAVVIAYPQQTYAWRTDSFTGWGNWSENPGRSLDAFWGGNQLYFDLECVTSSYDSGAVLSMIAVAGGAVAAIVVDATVARRPKPVG
jgi:peptide/nickel transport system substrate-binding protein